MELRQLRYFVAVAEDGNISRAAQKIFLTQPALSRQIKALEEELGQCLLERSAHSIRLTHAGENLLREARDLLAHADQMLERVRNTGSSSKLRVGYAPSFAAGILSAAVSQFTQVHPGTQVELFDQSSKEMLAALEADKIDLALTLRREGEKRGLQWEPLAKRPWGLAVSKADVLAKNKSVKAEALKGRRLCIFERSNYPEYWESLRPWLRKEGLNLSIAGEYDGAESVLAAVEAGLGIAFLPLSIGQLYPTRVCLLPLKPAPAPISIHVGLRADRAKDKQLRVFIEELHRAEKA